MIYLLKIWKEIVLLVEALVLDSVPTVARPALVVLWDVPIVPADVSVHAKPDAVILALDALRIVAQAVEQTAVLLVIPFALRLAERAAAELALIVLQVVNLLALVIVQMPVMVDVDINVMLVVRVDVAAVRVVVAEGAQVVVDVGVVVLVLVAIHVMDV